MDNRLPETNMFGVPIKSVPAAPISEVSPQPTISAKPKMETPPAMSGSGPSAWKIIGLMCSILILVIPGLFFFYVALLSYQEDGVGSTIIPGVIGVILVAGGIIGTVVSLRKK